METKSQPKKRVVTKPGDVLWLTLARTTKDIFSMRQAIFSARENF